MARGRGRGGQRGKRSRSQTDAQEVCDGGRSTGVQKCVSCMRDVGDEAIGCDECEGWVHNSEMCSGLTQDMLDAITRYSGGGIKFVCTKCRVEKSSDNAKSPGSPDSHLRELVAQLFQQIKGICALVQDLTREVRSLSAEPKPQHLNPDNRVPSQDLEQSYAAAARGAPNQPGSVAATPVPADTYRQLVREELRELDERKKRRCSLVIRGLGATSAEQAVVRFSHVTEFLIGEKVNMTEVVRISSATDLFRGKVVDDGLRRHILDNAKKLKDSEHFGSVYIRRDLTYHQRREKVRIFHSTRSQQGEILPGSQREGNSGNPQTQTPLADTLPKQRITHDGPEGGQGN